MQQLPVPFKTPLDYFNDVLGGDYNKIDKFKSLLESKEGWGRYDSDLHIYPYNKAVPGLLSVGCNNKCPFCPTAKTHKGKIHYGNPTVIIPQYENKVVHWMDENLFRHRDLADVLLLCKQNRVTWSAMADYKAVIEAIEIYGEDHLFDCGCRLIEVGLENVALYRKVAKPIRTFRIAIYYLNMTCLPGETKETIADNTDWMLGNSLRHPIHYNNGMWYACGQFYYPYGPPRKDGRMLAEATVARTLPTWIPKSLLRESYKITDLEKANHYNQLIYGRKMYRPKMRGKINSFIGESQKRAAWLLTAIRCGAVE